MASPEERLAKLSERATAKAADDAAQKAAVWSRIQAEAPDVADLLLAVNRAFGKPKSVRVRIGEETVL